MSEYRHEFCTVHPDAWVPCPICPVDSTDREAEVARIAAAVHIGNRSINVPGTAFVRSVWCRQADRNEKPWDECHEAKGHRAEAEALYDAGLRSTSRDSEVREAATTVVAAFEAFGADYVGLPVLVASLAAILDSSDADPDQRRSVS